MEKKHRSCFVLRKPTRRWAPPHGNVNKANVDAALGEGDVRGCGMIIRDSKG